MIVSFQNKYKPTFVVVDDFYQDPEKIRNFALSKEFHAHPKYHKGKRTNERYLFPGLKEKFESLLGHKITRWEEHGVNGCFQLCVGGDPIVYHVDAQQYAGVVFLTPDAPLDSGTQLLRSRFTGKTKLETDQDHSKVFQNGFLDKSTFDVVDTIGNRFNRLVLWDGRNLHCAQSYFGNSLENGRLFHLFFFDLE